MWTDEKALLNKIPNFKKLIDYGFSVSEVEFVYGTDIADGMFSFKIHITNDGQTLLEVVDKSTDEEYTLVYNENAVGSFVGRVRLECEEKLDDIIKNCYETELFKSEYSKQVAEYAKSKYGTAPEYLWEKTPNNSIFRDKTSKRWFMVFMLLEKRKLGIDQDGEVEIINLKETPKNVAKSVDGKRYFAGFHMNKKHWYTICLDGSVPIEEIFRRIDRSYALIKKK